MKYISIIVIVFFTACESEKQDPILPNNIAIICNQGSSYLTIIDISSEKIIEEINLMEKIHDYRSRGNYVNEEHLHHVAPHYVQASFDGKFIYIAMTHKIGGILKLDAAYNVIDYVEVTGTEYPAHLQLSSDNSQVFVSTWTTNTSHGGGTGTSSTNNWLIRYSHDFENRFNYITPAGSHGIKLTHDEQKIILGHDLSDYINIIKLNKLDTNNPLGTAIKLHSASNPSGGQDAIHSPTQVAISPDDKFVLFACKKSSKLLVYNLQLADTLGYLDLYDMFQVTNAGPYSIEFGPKDNYNSSEHKFVYINFKESGHLARIRINMSKTHINDIFTSNKNSDLIQFLNGDARPHGLDINNSGTVAVMSSENLNSNSSKSHIFIIDLINWTIKKEFNARVQARGVCIYPSIGN